MSDGPLVAYLSMEIALESEMPTYSGGLGVLAGDTIRSAADLGVRMLAVTLVHRRGYFAQQLDEVGRQTEAAEQWTPQERLEPLSARVEVEIHGRPVQVRAWRYRVRGVRGHEVPVYLLDTDLPENDPSDRRLTDSLYGGDDEYRLGQETVLGMGGVRMLSALGHGEIDRYHLNEGHAALAVLALLEDRGATNRQGKRRQYDEDLHFLRDQCVFTTHTPVPAGHDQFSHELTAKILGSERAVHLAGLTGHQDLNMTELALTSARFVNGVAMRHGEVSQGMFPDYPIRSITNGVHPGTWAAPAFRALYDRHIRHWREEPLSLRYAVGIPHREIGWAHMRAKQDLLQFVHRQTGTHFDHETLTLGFARRATAYKRASLVFESPDRLTSIAERVGPIQLIFAGKAHPHDEEGKALIRTIFEASHRLRGKVSVVYLPGYDLALGRLLCSGCDVWLNTPIPPMEASGTSGMKAALNGVPSLSILDGWWVEGCVEGVTGWAVGNGAPSSDANGRRRDARDAADLYDKLERAVAPLYYGNRLGFQEVMRNTISLNGSFFNTHRMVLQYLYDAYRDVPTPTSAPSVPRPGRSIKGAAD